MELIMRVHFNGMSLLASNLKKPHSITYYENYFFKIKIKSVNCVTTLNICTLLVSVSAASTTTASRNTLVLINDMLSNYCYGEGLNNVVITCTQSFCILSIKYV